MKFVDQIIDSHISITRVLHYLISRTHSHLKIILFLSLLFPLHLIVPIFLFFDNPLSFGPAQEHHIMLNRITTGHPSCHLRCMISFVTHSKGCLHKLDMKMLWGLSVIAIKGLM